MNQTANGSMANEKKVGKMPGIITRHHVLTTTDEGINCQPTSKLNWSLSFNTLVQYSQLVYLRSKKKPTWFKKDNVYVSLLLSSLLPQCTVVDFNFTKKKKGERRTICQRNIRVNCIIIVSQDQIRSEIREKLNEKISIKKRFIFNSFIFS